MLSPSSKAVRRPRSYRACSSVHATVLLPEPLSPVNLHGAMAQDGLIKATVLLARHHHSSTHPTTTAENCAAPTVKTCHMRAVWLSFCFTGAILLSAGSCWPDGVGCHSSTPHHSTQPFCSSRSSFCSVVTPPSCLDMQVCTQSNYQHMYCC